jgi:hypothetical protein
MQTLIENIIFTGAEQFGEQDGVQIIKGVCLLGSQSRNGYSYALEAMHKAANEGLYRDLPVFLNHSTSPGARDLMHLGGQVTNARFEGNRIRGDIKILPDAYGKKILDIARLMPGVGGFSHVASGKMVQRDGKKIVEQIERVFSVDCVSSPATSAGIFEGDNGERTVADQLRDFDELLSQGRRLLPFDPTSGQPNDTFSERNTMSDPFSQLDERFEAVDRQLETATKCLLGGRYQSAIDLETRTYEEKMYAERQAAHEACSTAHVAEAATALLGERETDSDFQKRFDEEQRRRHPLEHLRESERKDLLGCLLG